MGVSQRIEPAPDGVGRINHRVVPEADTQPEMIAPHVDGGFPMGQPLDGGEVGVCHLGRGDVGDAESRQRVAEALNDGWGQSLKSTHSTRDGERCDYQPKQGSRPPTPHQANGHHRRRKTNPCPPRLAGVQGSQHQAEGD